MQKQLHILSLVLVTAVACCLLWMQPYPILHDYPEWMYQGYLVGQLLAGGNAAITDTFSLVSHPVPNSLSQLAIGLLNLVVSPVLAGKLWLGAYLVFACWLWWSVTRPSRFTDGGSINLILTLTITLGAGFWNGYINFQFGLLFFTWYMIRPQTDLSVRSVLPFSLLIFFSHAAVFAAFVSVVLVRCLGVKDRWRYLVALVPSLLLLGWYIVVKVADGLAGGEVLPLIKWVQYKAYTVAKQGPFHNFIQPDGESLLAGAHWLYSIGFAINFLVVVIVAGWVCTLLWRQLRQRDWPDYAGDPVRRLSVIITLVLLFGGFLVAGQNSFGVVNLGERFLVVAMVLLLVFFRCPSLLRRVWVGVVVASSVYLLVATVLVTGYADKSYEVARSASEKNLQKYVDEVYANSRHKYFNHRLFIYADRGRELGDESPALLPIDLVTSIVVPRLRSQSGDE